MDHLRRGGAGKRVGEVSRRIRRHRHPDQRADAGLVHQVLRGELPLADQRAGDARRRRATDGSKSAGRCSCRKLRWRWRACCWASCRPLVSASCNWPWTPAARDTERRWPRPPPCKAGSGRAWSNSNPPRCLRRWCSRLVLGLMFLVVRALSKLGSASRRAAAPWLCGYVREADCHRYSAHNFYGEIKRYFRWLGGAPRPQREEPTAKP